jgi:hypothetical protein
MDSLHSLQGVNSFLHPSHLTSHLKRLHLTTMVSTRPLHPDFAHRPAHLAWDFAPLIRD